MVVFTVFNIRPLHRARIRAQCNPCQHAAGGVGQQRVLSRELQLLQDLMAGGRDAATSHY